MINIAGKKFNLPELEDLTENQKKVIFDKYQKDGDPTVSSILMRVAHNLALAELLYHPEYHKRIFNKVAHRKEEIDGTTSFFVNDRVALTKKKNTLEKILGETKDTSFTSVKKANFNQFIDNLERLYDKDEGARLIVSKIETEFYEMMSTFEFLPNSPTIMNAGGVLQQLAGCYVVDVPDSIEGWGETAKNVALIHQSGGGTGMSYRKVRPKGDVVGSTKGIASGPLSPLRMIDVTTDQVKQGGTRRGANMGILPINHPDIIEFIHAKDPDNKDTKRYPLENFNLSVGITEEWMEAALAGEDFDLINPHTNEVVGKLNAGEVFEEIVQLAHKTGDPGIVYLDRLNTPFTNPTPRLFKIESTNPCGEQPLGPYESCNLGSINLSKYLKRDEEGKTIIDKEGLEKMVHKTVHFLDNVIDMNNHPLPEIEKITKGNRKIGLGIMGFAEMLVALNIPYRSEKAVALAEEIMSFINETAMSASEELAKVRGAFPNYRFSVFNPDNEEYIGKPYKPRNAGRTTIAPTGTIGLASGLDGFGIEPLFGIAYTKKNANAIDAENRKEIPNEKDIFYGFIPQLFEVARKNNFFGVNGKTEDEKKKNLVGMILKNHGSIQSLSFIPEDVRNIFVTAHDVSYEWHIKIQSAFQKYTDHAVSKTINLPRNASVDDVRNAYLLSYSSGCKGTTVFRDGCKGGSQVVDFGSNKFSQIEFSKEIFPREKHVSNPSAEIEFDAYSPDGKKLPSVFITLSSQKRSYEEICDLIKEDHTKLLEGKITQEEYITKILGSQGGRLNQLFINQGKSGADENAHTESLGKLISLGLQMGIAPQVYYNTLVGIESSTKPRLVRDDKIIQFNSIEDTIAELLKEYITFIGEPLDKNELKPYYESQGLESPYCKKKFEIAETSPSTRKEIKFSGSDGSGQSKVYLHLVENTEGLLGEVFMSRGKSGGNENAHGESVGKLISIGLKYGMHPYIITRALAGIKSSQTAFGKNGIYQSLEDGIAIEMEKWYLDRGINIKQDYESRFHKDGLVNGLGGQPNQLEIQTLKDPCPGCGSREYNTFWESRGCGMNTCCDYKLGACTSS